jgi:RsiW-degrading membrane proteinase PrsW (M82 family)
MRFNLMQFPIIPSSPRLDPQPRYRTASLWQAGFSLLGSAGLLVFALRFVLRGLAWISNPQISRSDITGSFLLAASLAFCGVLLLPSAGFALARLAGWPMERFTWRWRIKPWIIVLTLGAAFLLVIGAGMVISVRVPLAWIALPPLHILAIGIPLAGVLYLGARGLPKGSPQRAWGILVTGMTLGPGMIFILEIAVLFAFVLMGAIVIAFSPDQLREFSHLVERLQSVNLSPEEMLPILQPYLKNPLVVFGTLFFMAGIVPMLEEALKPIGVWLLAKRHLTPAEGFVAGLLSGAGFALVESLGYTANADQSWGSSVILRAPTALMHILACGLTGWGLTSALSHHRIRWLLAGYGSAVAIHGLWNGLTLTAAGIVLLYPDQPSAQTGAGLALLGMFVLFGFGFLLLIWINHRLRQQTAHAIMSPDPALDINPGTIHSELESSLHEYHP